MRRFIIILAIATAASACRGYDVDEVLLQREDLSLTVKGDPHFIFDPLTCQFSHNGTTNEYRMFDDRLSDWVTLKCSQRPDTEGQSLTADISWTGSSSIRTEEGLKFVVQKTSADGYVWMWNKSKSIGIVIKNL